MIWRRCLVPVTFDFRALKEIEKLIAAEKQVTSSEGWRRVEAVVQLVGRHDSNLSDCFRTTVVLFRPVK